MAFKPPEAFELLRRRAEHGWELAKREPKLVNRGQVQVRLGEDQVAELLARYQAGETNAELAQAFGINRWTVTQIVKRAGVSFQGRRGT